MGVAATMGRTAPVTAHHRVLINKHTHAAVLSTTVFIPGCSNTSLHSRPKHTIFAHFLSLGGRTIETGDKEICFDNDVVCMYAFLGVIVTDCLEEHEL